MGALLLSWLQALKTSKGVRHRACRHAKLLVLETSLLEPLPYGRWIVTSSCTSRRTSYDNVQGHKHGSTSNATTRCSSNQLAAGYPLTGQSHWLWLLPLLGWATRKATDRAPVQAFVQWLYAVWMRCDADGAGKHAPDVGLLHIHN